MRRSLAPLLALMLCALLSLQIGVVSHEHLPSDLSYCDFCLQADSSASAFQVGTDEARVLAPFFAPSDLSAAMAGAPTHPSSRGPPQVC